VENPEQLVDNYIRDMKSDDPRIRLRTQDLINKFFEGYKTSHGEYQAWHSFISARSFYNANGCPMTVKAPFPKEPKREQDDGSIGKVNKLTPVMVKLAQPILRSLIVKLAESGMRIGSAVQIRYGDIKEDFEANRTPVAFRLRGRITKTGLSYWSFALDDARETIRDQLEMRKQRGEVIDDNTLVFPLDRDYAVQQIRDLSDLVGLNQTKRGLRSFCSKCWRKRVQTILERDEYHINPNHVSLILQAKPRGRDAHYSMPSKDELGKEYMKAANELRVLGPLYVKPTIDELLSRIQQLSTEERIRLISELEKEKEKGPLRCASVAPPQIVSLLSQFGLIEKEPKTIKIRSPS